MRGVSGSFRPLGGGGGGGGGERLELAVAAANQTTALTIDVEETVEKKIERLIRENQVIIFSRSSCCMCHVMKRLLYTLGVNPTVIELEEGEMGALPAAAQDSSRGGGAPPAVYIGGRRIGGLESLMAMHLGGDLVPKLREVGALY
ncbi:Glutaredoxin [Macleaya cordata]|uniref:Glutaredoxin n=1 Tax=Macleaya cordata TaxID=56857 RepID=A0A200QCF6_MACCD|nr:Glutaredoxin [Macleaya cordata]